MAAPCVICDRTDGDVVVVHAECIPHRHRDGTGPAEPLSQDENAILVGALVGMVEQYPDDCLARTAADAALAMLRGE